VAAGVLTLLHLVDRLPYFADLVVAGVPAGGVGQLALLMVPSLLAHTLPVATLLATLLTVGRQAANLESLAFHAAGVSPVRLLRPFLVVALAVTGVTAVLTVHLELAARRALERRVDDIRRTRPATVLQERVFNVVGDYVIYVDAVLPSRRDLRGILVADERDATLTRLIAAPRGYLAAGDGQAKAVLRLLDGAAHESRDVTGSWYRRSAFTSLDIDLSGHAPPKPRSWTPRPEKRMGMWDLLSQTRSLEMRTDVQRSWPLVIEFHKRLALPVAPVVFAVLGFALGHRLGRHGRYAPLAASVVIMVTYYLLLFTLEAPARHNRLPPWIAAWTPVVLFGVAGLALLRSSLRPRMRPLRTRRRLGRRPAARAVGAGAPDPGRRPSTAAGRARAAWIVDRHLLREFLTYLASGLAVAAAVFVIVDLFETLDRYARSRPPVGHVLEHFAYRLPAALHQALPVVVLLSSILLFMRLGQHHELTALKAAGVSLYRVASPVLLLAVALGVASFGLQETVLPSLSHRGDEVDRVMVGGEPPRHLHERTDVWFRGADDRFLRVDRLDPRRQALDGVMLLEVAPPFRVVTRLDADRVRWTSEGWQSQASVLREFGADERVRATAVGRGAVSLPASLDALGVAPRPPAAMSALELRRDLERVRRHGHPVGSHAVLLHSKLAFPAIHIVFAALAIPCALRWAGSARVAGVVLAVAIAAAYWVTNALALALGKAGLLPPAVAAWAANVIFGGLALGLFCGTRS